MASEQLDLEEADRGGEEENLSNFRVGDIEYTDKRLR